MFRLRRRTPSFALVALLGAANALAACGNGGNEDGRALSSGTASELRATLDEIEQSAADGDCDGAGEQAARLAQQASSLPADVNADLRDALTSGVNRLRSLLDKQCEQAAPVAPPPTTETEPRPQEMDEQEDKQKEPKKPKETKPPDEQQGRDEQQGGDQQQDGGAQGENQSGDGGSGPGTGGVTP